MLDDKFLEKWVPIIVDEKYGPNKDPAAGKKILGIYIIPAEEMEDIKNKWYNDTSEDIKLHGQLVDLGEILTLVSKKESKLKGRYVIRLNASQSEASGIFALAHEIGHLYGIITNDEEHEQNQEEFADGYAFKRIKETIDDSALRAKIFIAAFLHERI